MNIHLLSARDLGAELARGAVSSQAQAIYLSASFILWLLPGYLLIVPAPNVQAWSLPLGLWSYEGCALLLTNIFGVAYCLARCQVEPRKNFLIDFSCLYAPISLTTLVVVWGIFHLYASFVPWSAMRWVPDSRTLGWLQFFYSERFADLMRFAAVVSASFFVFVRIGNHMQRVAKLRLSANTTVERDGLQAARSSP